MGGLVTAMFTLLSAKWAHEPFPYFNFERVKILDVLGVCGLLLALAFIRWAYLFVMSFQKSFRIAVSRARDIENFVYASEDGFFSKMNVWISDNRTPSALGRYSKIFLCLIAAFWICLAAGVLFRGSAIVF
jgi:hypothetical protein